MSVPRKITAIAPSGRSTHIAENCMLTSSSVRAMKWCIRLSPKRSVSAMVSNIFFRGPNMFPWPSISRSIRFASRSVQPRWSSSPWKFR